MAPLLGYWNIRGLAQPIRLLLAHAGVEVEEKRYNYGPPPTFDRSEWTNVKPTLGLDFPNLPYYIDGDVKLTQSVAIMRYLSRKHRLDGANECEKSRIDLIEQQLVDCRGPFVTLMYSPDHEEKKGEYINSLPNSLKGFNAFLATNDFFAGKNLSYVDFMIYEILDQVHIFAPQTLDGFPSLREFLARVEALPNIAKYIKSDNYIAWPLNGDAARFGSRHQKRP